MDFLKLKQHQNIRIIEYTLNHNTFSKEKITKDLGISIRDFNFARSSLFSMTTHQAERLTDLEETDWCLSNEALFNYLQYKEFEHSLANSKLSNRIAVGALILSVVSVVITASGIFV